MANDVTIIRGGGYTSVYDNATRKEIVNTKKKRNRGRSSSGKEYVAQNNTVYEANGSSFNTVSKSPEVTARENAVIEVNNKVNTGQRVTAKDLAYGGTDIKLIESDKVVRDDNTGRKYRLISPDQTTSSQATADRQNVLTRETLNRNNYAENKQRRTQSPFFYGYEAVANTTDNGFVYQGVSSGLYTQFSAVPQDVGSNIKSYSLNSIQKTQPIKKSWVDKYNENPLQNVGAYDRKVFSNNGLTNSFSRFAGINNNIIDVKYGKTAVQKIQTLPKAEIIRFTGNVGIGAGQIGVELGKVGVEVGKGLYSNLKQGGNKVAIATGLYGDIGISNDGRRRKATLSQRAELFATGNVEVASTLNAGSSSTLKLLNSKTIKTVFNAVGIGLAGYEGVKLAKNPSDVQTGRFLATSSLGVFGTAGIYSDLVKPKIIRTIVNREVPDVYLSPIAKAPPEEAYFKNVVFGDIRLNVKPAFDNPQGRNAKERRAETQRRIADATTEQKVVNYLKINKLYSNNSDLAGNTFIVTQNRQRVAKGYVELTTSAQAGVRGTKVGGSPKSVAGIEEDILFMSAKGYGEPAFLRIQNVGANSDGYNLAPSIFDYFKTPTLFNTKVRAVKDLPASIRYAKFEGVEKANAFYRSQANVGDIYGYNTLRSSASIGKGRPSIITVKQDYTFENGKKLLKGTRMRMGSTKEDEIAIGSGQEFKLLRSKGWRGYLANKLYGSTIKRIELELGGEKIPIPLQEAKLTSRKGIKPEYDPRKSSSKIPTRPNNLKQMQKQLDAVADSYIRQRKSLTRPTSTLSRPSTVSTVSSVSRTSFTSSPSKVSRTSSPSSSNVVSRLSILSSPSRVSNTSRVSNVSRTSSVSKVSNVSRISRLSSFTSITRVPKIPKFKLPRFNSNRMSSALPTGSFNRQFAYKTSLFAYTNRIRGKRNKFGETSGLGIRPL